MEGEGVMVVENNLFRAPVVKQKSDGWILGRYKMDAHNEFKYYLRQTEWCYVVG